MNNFSTGFDGPVIEYLPIARASQFRFPGAPHFFRGSLPQDSTEREMKRGEAKLRWGAQRSFLRVNEPKKTGACSARAQSAPKIH
jgi:hypothetical protein